MTERLGRLRGPAVVALLIVLTGRILLATSGFVLLAPSVSSVEELAALGANAATWVTDPLTVVVLTVVLASTVVWSPIASARAFGTWAMAVVGLGVLLSLVADVGWLVGQPTAASTLWSADAVLRLVVPVLALVALARLRPERSAAMAGELTPEPSALALEPAESQPEADPSREPTWQPDQAAGAAWMKAGDAASGAAASGWGTAGDAGGWSPQTRDEVRALPPSTVPGPTDPGDVADRYRLQNPDRG